MTATPRIRLGMLTPSSNTVLEPVCAAMLAGVPHVTAHFARFPVTRISLAPDALEQFSPAPMLAAAAMLAHARVDAICWNGTSGAWLGLDVDRSLCRSITERTGAPATSSMLALADVLRRSGRTRYALVTPYTDDVQARIVDTLGAEGFSCVAERHLNVSDNHAFSMVEGDTLAGMMRDVAAATPQAIVVLCTNLRAMPLVEAMEAELGIPIYDSIGTAVWSALRLAGQPPGLVAGWGSLFGELA